MQCDVAVIGAGIGGLATAARLQAAGLSTIVFESHGQPGGCAGFFRRRGFSFDVGATTLVDFEPGGVGGELLDSIGMQPIGGEALPGYVAWLPDRQVTLYRDRWRWQTERLRALGSTPSHMRFWHLMDQLAETFWQASRRGIKLPIQNVRDLIHAIECIGFRNLSKAKYWNWTLGDALRCHGLRHDTPLVGLLSMLVEDTVHSTVDEAPLVNAALGITIRGAGLTRARGGMRGFWQDFVRHYRGQGGRLLLGNPVRRVTGRFGEFSIETRRGCFGARQIVSAVPATLTARMAPRPVRLALQPYRDRDAESLGGAIVVFLGVPESEVAGQSFTHHQLLHDYSERLGNGNNMFISVSARGDGHSAPPGHRTVMLSTHCELDGWRNLTSGEYRDQKRRIGARLLKLAQRVYRDLGHHAVVYEVGTPRTYARFTGRPGGAVGGVRQSLQNANQAAVPHSLGCRGFWLAGDTTWPGLGTVACVLGSRVVAEGVLAQASRPMGSRAVPRNDHRRPEPELPHLSALGLDLLATTGYQRRLALARPFLGLFAFALAAYAEMWWLAPIIMFLIFVAVVTATHDVVHGSLGLTERKTEWALFILGAMLLESGHAYRTTHMQHHRTFPGTDDPEGDPARMSFWGAIVHGVVFLPRLWLWAFSKNRGRPDQRLWLIVEAAWAFALVLAGTLLWSRTPAVLLYALLAIAGSWVYPLLTVHLPHHHYGPTPLTQTRTLRGWLIPKLFLELTYHLEHHLYPQVPSHNLAKLSRRLDPFLRRAGIVPRRVL